MPGTEKVLGEALSLGLSPHSKVSAWRTGHAIFISLSRAPGMRSGDRKAGQQPGGAATPPTFPELGPKQRGQAHPGHMVGLHTSLCFIPSLQLSCRCKRSLSMALLMFTPLGLLSHGQDHRTWSLRIPEPWYWGGKAGFLTAPHPVTLGKITPVFGDTPRLPQVGS